MPFCCRISRSNLTICLIVIVGAFHSGPSICGAADESLGVYFEQLRVRGLFSIAESYAVSRLAQPNIARTRRIDLTIELSRTLAAHAEFASEQQQPELWKQARTVVDEERLREPASPFALLLAAQSALVVAGEVEWLRPECELHPFDDTLTSRTRQHSDLAIQLLSEMERDLLAPNKEKPKNDVERPSTHALRTALHHVRLALAQSLKTRAELMPADSRERTVDLVNAEQTARKLIGAAEEPIPFRASLLLVACLRLRGDLNGADKMLALLDKGTPTADRLTIDELVAERARILLMRHQAPDALAIIVKRRSQEQRLSGELWFLQTRSLLTMRNLAISRKDMELANQLRDQAEVAMQRCHDQVGGFWSRRCRDLWDSTQSSEKYGPELDGLMQQARADFVGGRIEASVKGYARAELAARAAGKTDLALDLGYTRASILLQEKQYDSAGTEFLRLADEYPESPRAPSAHLNGSYCLGRLYDEQKTQQRRERYSETLDRHLERFSDDPTADDARFFKAYLEEQRLQATIALPLYLKVADTHPRAAEAHAGAARCYETILVRMRDKKLPTAEFEQTAIKTLKSLVPDPKESTERLSITQTETAVHFAAILLLAEPPQFENAEAILQIVIQSTAKIDEADSQRDRWLKLRQRAESLQVVAMAGNEHPLEAERLIVSLAKASPRDLMVIAERLAPFVATQNRQRQLQYVTLQLHAIELLVPHKKSLSREEQDRLEQFQARAYLVTGESGKALEIYEQLATASAKDANRQREIAGILAEATAKEYSVLAKQCWRRAESLSKQGSADWFTARLGVITASVKLNEQADAKKLLTVTKLLYPELGGPELKKRFLELEQKLGK